MHALLPNTERSLHFIFFFIKITQNMFDELKQLAQMSTFQLSHKKNLYIYVIYSPPGILVLKLQTDSTKIIITLMTLRQVSLCHIFRKKNPLIYDGILIINTELLTLLGTEHQVYLCLSIQLVLFLLYCYVTSGTLIIIVFLPVKTCVT